MSINNLTNESSPQSPLRDLDAQSLTEASHNYVSTRVDDCVGMLVDRRALQIADEETPVLRHALRNGACGPDSERGTWTR